jgi:phospholipase/lecithinase/hemolysin
MTILIKQMSQAVAGTAIALATVSMQPVMAASVFDQIFVFGDSLVDAGNLYNLTGGGIAPSPIYSNGRFSNGPVWSDYLAADLGLSPALWILSPTSLTNVIPSDGINFAIAGAKTDDKHITLDPELPGLKQQIDYFTGFLLGGGSINNPNTLAIVSAGANDYLGGQMNPQIPVDHLSMEIQRLADVGVKNILVSNLPDLGKTPLALSSVSGVSEGLTTLTMIHNALLDQSLNQLRQLNPNTNLIEFDLYASLNNIGADPSFINVTEGCTNINLLNVPPLPDPLFNPNCGPDLAVQNQFLFLDNQHPTTKAHQLIADAALRTLIPVPEPSVAPAVGLLGLVLLGKASHKRRLIKKREKAIAQFHPFNTGR